MDNSIWSGSLDSFQRDLSAAQPAPAAVAAAAVTADLGIALLIKSVTITGKRRDLVDTARLLSAHLKHAADEDIAAVRDYMAQRSSSAGIRAIEIPMNAARSAVTALDLCVEAADHVKTALRADLASGAVLLA